MHKHLHVNGQFCIDAGTIRERTIAHNTCHRDRINDFRWSDNYQLDVHLHLTVCDFCLLEGGLRVSILLPKNTQNFHHEQTWNRISKNVQTRTKQFWLKGVEFCFLCIWSWSKQIPIISAAFVLHRLATLKMRKLT